MKYIGIFQGGGVKGIAHLGAVKALEERGFFCSKAAGTSVGAIIASLLCVGYHSDELVDCMMNLDISQLKQKGKMTKIFKDLGYYSSSPLEKYLEKLYHEKQKRVYRDVKIGDEYTLKVVVTDILKRKQVIIPDDLREYHLDPDSFSIARSVVMSSTYPLFYKPLRFNKSLMMDGAISNNFPLDAFGQNQELPTIGFHLVRELGKITTLANPYIIQIPTLGIKTLDFNITKEEKIQLYRAGYCAGRDFVRSYFSLYS